MSPGIYLAVLAARKFLIFVIACCARVGLLLLSLVCVHAMRRASGAAAALLVSAIILYHNQMVPRRSVVVSPAASHQIEQPQEHALTSHEQSSQRQSPAIHSTDLSPPPVPAASSSLLPPPPPPCGSLSCTTKLSNLEPPWVKLAFQPRIDWRGGGVRGDCVVGEYEYIMPAYCSPPGQPQSVRGNWPSEERLEAADVHSANLPKASLREIATALPNQTLLIMGDSVMEQFYNALQCLLRKEELEAPTDPSFLDFIKTNEYLWKMGKRKMPPKLPQQASTGMRMLFSRQVNYQPTDVTASIASGNVIVVNWGLHYHDMGQYRSDLHAAFALFDAHAAKTGNAVLFRETGAQHFKMADGPVGMVRSSSGEWERRDRSTDRHCQCSPIEVRHMTPMHLPCISHQGVPQTIRPCALPSSPSTGPCGRSSAMR